MTDAGRINLITAAMLSATFTFLITSAQAKNQPHQKGAFTAVFHEYSPLSDTISLSKRMRKHIARGDKKNHHYDIERESYNAYVPDCYDPNAHFGLLVWVPAGKGNPMDYPDMRQLMDKHRLIWVSANNSGNKTDVYKRRIPLALDAAYNMQKLYSIDPNRVYVGGISGGGRVASITAFHHSDVYNGGIFVIGANYWKRMRVPGKKTYWRQGGPTPRGKYLAIARKFGKYVLLTGDNDGNRLQMHTYYEKVYSKLLDNVLYIQVPGMGHEPPPAEEFDKALEFVDRPVHPETPLKRATKKEDAAR